MKTRRIIVGSVLLLVIIAIGGWGWLSQAQAATNDPAFEATGVIEAREINLAPELGGKVVEVLVEEGQHVTLGQPLIRLDDTLLGIQRTQAEAALAAAQAQRDTAQANYDLLKAGAQPEQIAAAQQAVKAADAAQWGAAAQLAQMQAGARGADIAAAEAAVAQAAAQLKLAQDTHDQTLKCGTIPLPNGKSQEICPGLGTREEQARAALTAASEAYSAAQKRLDQLKAGATKNELNAVSAQVRSAQAQRSMAQAQLELIETGARPEQLAAAHAQVKAAGAQIDAATAAIELLKAQIDKLTLRAPVTSTVLNRAVEPGEVIMPGATVLKLGRLDRLELTVYVPEQRFGLATPDQTVSIRVDAYPDRVFSGVVLRVADEAEFTPTNVQTKEDRTRLVYAVVIGLDNPDLALKPGMIADVTFGP